MIEIKRLHYEIRGMNCAACVAHVEKALCSVLTETDTVTVSLLTNSVSILLSEDPPSVEALEERLSAAVRAGGYTLVLSEKDTKNETDEFRRRVLRFIVSAAFTLVVMYLAMGGMLHLPIPRFLAGAENGVSMALAQLLFTLPVLILNRGFFVGGFRALFSRAPNMDSLIAVGAGASVVYGLVSLGLMLAAKGDVEILHARLHDLYFESAAMILTLVSLGKLLESRAKDKAAGAIRSLATLSPKFATVLRDGRETSVAVESIAVGDVLLLRPGDLVPVDGTVIDGVGSTDESAITGESIPIEKTVGAPVRAAAVVIGGYLTVRAEEVGENTSLARIIRLLEDAAAGKPPIARIADRVSGVFVPIVMAISAVTLGVWLLFTHNVEQALRSAISVLVISCPCALGLATPTAITVGLGRSASHGILFRNAVSLENLASVRTVVFDKTGTVTEGNPSLTDAIGYGVSPAALLSLAAAIEVGSSHPLALAVRRGAQNAALSVPAVKDHQTTVGVGVSARLGSHLCAVVKPAAERTEPTEGLLCSLRQLLPAHPLKADDVRAIERANVAAMEEDLAALERQGKTAVVVTADGAPVGILGISDRIRRDARDAISALRGHGVRCLLLTGDRPTTAQAVAADVGIEEVHASLLPEDKEAIVRSLTESGSVAMVGDGINDAPSLVRATVGIAIGAGTETAIESADVVLSQSSPMGVVNAFRISRATIRIIRQNLFWALFYNAVCIPVAAGVLYPVLGWQLSPMLASAAMSLSSVTVVTNALRLKRISLHKGEKDMFGLFGNKKKTAPVLTDDAPETQVLTVEGMMCPRCVAHVKEALEKVPGVRAAEVSLDAKTATVTAVGVTKEALANAIRAAGYEVK